MRFGLCCIFHEAPIKFRTTTATYVSKLQKNGEDYLKYLSEIVLDNACALEEAIQFCYENNIGSFRINSQFFPLITYSTLQYQIPDLPDAKEILSKLDACKKLAKKLKIRLVLHPDQFVVLSSPHESVVNSSISELEYHGVLAEYVGVDVINIHGGGVYGNKQEALERFVVNFKKLSKTVRERLTVENDDKCYSPEDLLPLCNELKIPLVYDVHHHRCLKDKYSVEEAVKLALKTWSREPLFHISSPMEGWEGKNTKIHHDFIDPQDFPKEWLTMDITVEIEAKAKETAIRKLQKDLKWKS